MADLALGIRLNNLLNIRLSADHWQGADYSDPTNTVFVKFTYPKWGIRAAARIHILHQDHLGKGTATVRDLIKVWAPPTENDTETYIKNVCQWSGLVDGTEYDFNTYDPMFKLIQAQIQEEVGLPNYDKTTIDAGLQLAGIVVPLVPAAKSPVFQVASVTAILGAATPVITAGQGLISSAGPFAPVLFEIAKGAPYAIGAALLVGAIYLVIHELKKRSI